jgi:hypothetical protein
MKDVSDMRTVRNAALMVTGAVVGRTVARTIARRRGGRGEEPRWLVVTVNAAPDKVEAPLAEAVAELDVETRLSAAPGGRGTEAAARLQQHGPAGPARRLAGKDPRQDVRRALRDVKSMVEAGEVVRPDEPTTGKWTPGGALVRLATRRAGGEGRL